MNVFVRQVQESLASDVDLTAVASFTQPEFTEDCSAACLADGYHGGVEELKEIEGFFFC